jgi:hypothetical protein
MIHQNPAHQPRRHSKKLRPMLPVHLLLIHQTQICFIDQSRCLQRVPRPLPAHVTMRHLAEFLLDKWDQFVEATSLAGSPAAK